MKRAFDVVVALAALILLLPLMAVLAVWIKLDSPGGAIFTQQRVGRHGQLFRILKFRTMHVGAESMGQITQAADKRVTRAGRILRRSRLDELPQLFNILLGHMSFVGPRPEVPKYVAKYPAEARATILSVRPGLTDPATLMFRNETEILRRYDDPDEAYSTVILPQKVRMYLEYVQSRTLLGDLILILRTVAALVPSRR